MWSLYYQQPLPAITHYAQKSAESSLPMRRFPCKGPTTGLILFVLGGLCMLHHSGITA